MTAICDWVVSFRAANGGLPPFATFPARAGFAASKHAATVVPEVGRRLRCSQCGGKRINTRPAWHTAYGQWGRRP